LVLRISFIFSLIIHLIFRSVNLVTELLLCVNNFGIGESIANALGIKYVSSNSSRQWIWLDIRSNRISGSSMASNTLILEAWLE
jgi:hypothetical protein